MKSHFRITISYNTIKGPFTFAIFAAISVDELWMFWVDVPSSDLIHNLSTRSHPSEEEIASV
jgi:hypothetical protein